MLTFIQRAFRQRKEGYIKKLEEQVRDFQAMQESYKQIQTENYQLRDYIISLQSRVIEIQGEDALPPPPVTLVHSPPQLMLDPNQQQQAVPQQQQQAQQPPPMAPQQQQPQQQQQQQIPAPMATMGQTQEIATGQKRPHDDSDSAFLQSIAQAAANPTAVTGAPQVSQAPVMNGFVSIQAADAAKATGRKSSSPQSKRVKAEEQKNNGVPVTSLNGTMTSSS